MKRRAFLLALALGLIVLAVSAWTLQGLRFALTGRRSRRGRLAPA